MLPELKEIENKIAPILTKKTKIEILQTMEAILYKYQSKNIFTEKDRFAWVSGICRADNGKEYYAVFLISPSENGDLWEVGVITKTGLILQGDNRDYFIDHNILPYTYAYTQKCTTNVHTLEVKLIA